MLITFLAAVSHLYAYIREASTEGMAPPMMPAMPPAAPPNPPAAITPIPEDEVTEGENLDFQLGP
ncbi:hypothetical protein AAVH_40271 [Aphelenchoides avenae]|nr:hypothetical protein AAVH_40271 [Aphelenchus avenae]